MPSRIVILRSAETKDNLSVFPRAPISVLTTAPPRRVVLGGSFYVRHRKRGWDVCPNPLRKLAEPTRLELAPSGVTGRRYNQLNYGSAYGEGRPLVDRKIWWAEQGSNL